MLDLRCTNCGGGGLAYDPKDRDPYEGYKLADEKVCLTCSGTGTREVSYKDYYDSLSEVHKDAEFFKTGSYTYTGVVSGDFDILVHPKTKEVLGDLVKSGYVISKVWGQGNYSLNLGQLNIIYLEDKIDYDNWVIAAKICTKLRLTDKEQVIYVHDTVRGV